MSSNTSIWEWTQSDRFEGSRYARSACSAPIMDSLTFESMRVQAKELHRPELDKYVDEVRREINTRLLNSDVFESQFRFSIPNEHYRYRPHIIALVVSQLRSDGFRASFVENTDPELSRAGQIIIEL